MKSRIVAFALTAMLSAAVAANAAKRQIVPVPPWNEFDGVHWGDVALGETTRAAFEQDYSCRPTELPGVLKANTPGRTDTAAFVAFDGVGADARLVSIVCFYESSRGRPTPAEFESRAGGSAREGYLPTRHADWRMRVAAGLGLAAVIERQEQRERVVALLFSRPELLEAAARRLSASETRIVPLLVGADVEPLVARVRDIDVDVHVDSGVSVKRRDLEREMESAATSEILGRALLRRDFRSGGQLAVTVDVSPRLKQDKKEVRITARARLYGEGPYGMVRADSYESKRDLAADSSESRIRREARRLVEEVIGSVASSAERALEAPRQRALDAAQKRSRLALVSFVAGIDRGQ